MAALNPPQEIGVTDDPNHPHRIGGPAHAERDKRIAQARAQADQAHGTPPVEYCPVCDFPEFEALPDHVAKMCWRHRPFLNT